jgi:hypothetical protein
MKDPDLKWPFSTKKVMAEFNKNVIKGAADDPMAEAVRIVLLLSCEVERLREMLKREKGLHYQDAEHLCNEVVRLRNALIWIRRNLGGGKEYVEQAFAATAEPPEKSRKRKR